MIEGITPARMPSGNAPRTERAAPHAPIFHRPPDRSTTYDASPSQLPGESDGEFRDRLNELLDKANDLSDIRRGNYHDPKEDEERSTLAKLGLGALVIGGATRNLVLDPLRVAVKLPWAAEHGRLGMALRQMVTAAPTNELFHWTGPLSTRLDRTLYRTSYGTGAVFGGIQLGQGIIDSVEAVKENGTDALVNTKQGRTGALNVIGGGVATGLMGAAVLSAARSGTTGAWPLLMKATANPIFANPWVVGIGIGTAVIAGANELGFFDFLDEGNTRSVAEVFGDGVDNLEHAAQSVWEFLPFT